MRIHQNLLIIKFIHSSILCVSNVYGVIKFYAVQIYATGAWLT